ncbi:MAG TPA: hypothetical protein VFW66_12380 [Gemmatimonadales bacterium]|nr:hypothetical protein [Gemmatimonadales bacterium]
MIDSVPATRRHLTEAERHGIADDSLPERNRAAVTAHLSGCDACADDVARLTAFMARIDRDRQAPAAALDALWPAIRARIERGNSVPTSEPGPRARWAIDRRWWWVGAAAAAAWLAVALSRPGVRPPLAPATIARAGDPAVREVLDSARTYEQQVTALLEELELRRSTLRPATAAALDHDLRVVDGAIAELHEALAHDPDNPALHQLLAASYRQKRDLLRRVDNAS